MELVRIVKGVSEIVDYDEITAKRMIEKNPDRYKTIEDFEMVKDQYDKKEDEPEKEIEDLIIEKVEDIEIPEFEDESQE